MMPRRRRPTATTTGGDRTSALFGRDHRRRGKVALHVVPPVALGLTRGWRRKPYPSVDANEDAVGCIVEDGAQLLVAADGHNGIEASHAALATVLELFDDGPLPTGLDEEGVLDIAQAVERRIALAGPGRGAGPVRTTLVVALRTMTQVVWLSGGDSELFVVDPDGAEAAPTITRWFFGDRFGRAYLRARLAHGTLEVSPSAWVVLVTDGYTNFPVDQPPSRAVNTAVAGASGPLPAVEALLDQAREGGAGDNVGVVVSAPW